jgi:hypothetical protein
MHISIRQVVNWAAIYAIALRAILLGVTPVVVGGAVAGDPLSIICHSDGQALAPSEQPAAPGNVPGQSCEHCNLCSAVTAPAAPDGILGTILPSQVAHVLRPTSSTPRIDHQSDPKLARGPPLFA